MVRAGRIGHQLVEAVIIGMVGRWKGRLTPLQCFGESQRGCEDALRGGDVHS